MLLALDTATEWAAVALYDPQKACVCYEAVWWARRQHTTQVLPHIDRALSQLTVQPKDLTAVAVAIGPGSYTGLRVGLSLAKGIALTLDVPLIAVPTLDIVAYAHRHANTLICAVIQAGRSRVGWALYRPSADPQPADGYHLDDVPKLIRTLAELDQPVLIAGELTPEQRSAFKAALEGRTVLSTPADGARRPGFLAELAYHRWQRGQRDDPDTLAPIYLRQPAGS